MKGCCFPPDSKQNLPVIICSREQKDYWVDGMNSKSFRKMTNRKNRLEICTNDRTDTKQAEQLCGFGSNLKESID